MGKRDVWEVSERGIGPVGTGVRADDLTEMLEEPEQMLLELPVGGFELRRLCFAGIDLVVRADDRLVTRVFVFPDDAEVAVSLRGGTTWGELDEVVSDLIGAGVELEPDGEYPPTWEAESWRLTLVGTDAEFPRVDSVIVDIPSGLERA